MQATGSRECAPDDRLREAIHGRKDKVDWFVAEFIIGSAKGGTRWLLAKTWIGTQDDVLLATRGFP